MVQYRKLLPALDSLSGEDQDFWLSIINDSSYLPEQRAWSAFMLLKRHVKPGMKLKELPSPFASGFEFVQAVTSLTETTDTVYANIGCRGRVLDTSSIGFGRPVIRPGLTRNIGFYLSAGRRRYEDSSFIAFKERAQRNKWVLLKIQCSIKDAGKELRLYMAFSAGCTAERLNARLYGRSVSATAATEQLMDVYVPDFERLEWERRENDDL